MTKRFLRYSGLGLAVFTVGAIAACGSSDPVAPSSNAGSSAAGAPAGGQMAGGGLPGTAGSITNGGAAGGTGGAGSGFACTGIKPTSPLITEFADLVVNATSAGNYTFMLGVPGGTFTYQPAALTVATTGMAFNVKGNVKDYDGFGVYFNSCTDASAFSGVSFSIKGKAGATGMLNFRVQTNSDTAIDTKNMKGLCVVPAGTTDTYPLCHASGVDIPVTEAGATVMVNFSQLTGGIPVEAITGKDIVGLEWAFNWTPPVAGGAGSGAGGGAGSAAGGAGGAGAGAGGAGAGAGGAGGGAGGAGGGAGGAGTGGGSNAAGAGGTVNNAAGAGGAGGGATVAGAYDADITIDDIKFIGGAMGGAGGAASGGAGGASAGAGGASGGAGGASAGSGGASGGAGGAKAGSGGSVAGSN